MNTENTIKVSIDKELRSIKRLVMALVILSIVNLIGGTLSLGSLQQVWTQINFLRTNINTAAVACISDPNTLKSNKK